MFLGGGLQETIIKKNRLQTKHRTQLTGDGIGHRGAGDVDRGGAARQQTGRGDSGGN